MLVKLVEIPANTKLGNVVQVAEFHYAGKAWLRKEHGIGPFRSDEVNLYSDEQHVRADSKQTLNRKKRL